MARFVLTLTVCVAAVFAGLAFADAAADALRHSVNRQACIIDAAVAADTVTRCGGAL